MEDGREYRKKKRTNISEADAIRVVVAPSWGDSAVLETQGVELLSVLLEAGYDTTVRPHPMTVKRSPQVIQELASSFGNHHRFRLQIEIEDKASLYESNVMISDWSGVAIEYALACEQPVIFIDVPKKNLNPEVNAIPNIPFETTIREKIGRVVPSSALDTLPTVIEELNNSSRTFVDRIRSIREESVFNLGNSSQVGAGYLVELLNQSRQRKLGGRVARV